MNTLNKVVARFKDGILMKGTTSDFFPNKNEFHLKLISGEIATIDCEKLKAIFFVKDFMGNKIYKEIYTDAVPGGGRKVKVEFLDGEIIIGFSQGYSPSRSGFFLIPADKQGNNERIYVITSAIKNVVFL
jgi:hypothetical protein